MPNLNIQIDQDLLRAIRVQAASEDKNRQDWVVERLEEAIEQRERVSAKGDGRE